MEHFLYLLIMYPFGKDPTESTFKGKKNWKVAGQNFRGLHSFKVDQSDCLLPVKPGTVSS